MAEPDGSIDPTFYAWPRASRFGRVVPKNRIVEHGALKPAIRRKLSEQVQQIRWSHKLATETTNLSAGSDVLEIQVLAVQAKLDDVDDDVLVAIDKAIPHPVVFEITAGGEEPRSRMTAALKEVTDRTVTVGTYYSTPWVETPALRQPLPPVPDLGVLYDRILAGLLPTQVRKQENVSEASERLIQAAKLERELSRLQVRMRNEPQFNRKAELRRTIRKKEAELERLR